MVTSILTCRAGWGSSSRQLPGGQQLRRRGPRPRSRQRAFRVSGPPRSSRGVASPYASPTGLQHPPLQKVCKTAVWDPLCISVVSLPAAHLE